MIITQINVLMMQEKFYFGFFETSWGSWCLQQISLTLKCKHAKNLGRHTCISQSAPVECSGNFAHNCSSNCHLISFSRYTNQFKLVKYSWWKETCSSSCCKYPQITFVFKVPSRSVPFICHLQIAEEELMKCFNSEMTSLGPMVPYPADGLNGMHVGWMDPVKSCSVWFWWWQVGEFIGSSAIFWAVLNEPWMAIFRTKWRANEQHDEGRTPTSFIHIHPLVVGIDAYSPKLRYQK